MLTVSLVVCAVIDRFTHYTLQFLERVSAASDATLAQLFDSCAPLRMCMMRLCTKRTRPLTRHHPVAPRSYERRLLQSTATPRVDLFRRPLSDVRITDFFGARSFFFWSGALMMLLDARGGSHADDDVAWLLAQAR